MRRVQIGEDGEGYSVEGTPAEAAGLGIMALSGGAPFDLVIAGINRGENTGLANLYSGTVNAAMEALVRGAPAIAVSQDAAYDDDFAFSAALTRKFADRVLKYGLPQGVMLNVNIPVDPRGVVIVPSRGLSVAVAGFDASEQEDGAVLYAPRMAAVNDMPDGDVRAYLERYVSVAPLALDRTSNDAFGELGWIGDVEF
ncbi:5'/3'-nucleotidase SurE [Hyphococcus luteus]|uniref:5'/3'-nucleotidase SurE n=1 Tax=Hyphococcus luteus TaxID=2058213 RepID=UPI0013FD3BEE|nr:5'/3'-nucleotidase SurE [Marinicaulis flavus]